MIKEETMSLTVARKLCEQLKVCYLTEDIEAFKSRMALIPGIIDIKGETVSKFYSFQDGAKAMRVMFGFLKKNYPELFEEKAKVIVKTSYMA